MKRVHVAVGVILCNDNVFICQRNANQHQGGKWEFPGGKVDAGESAFDALVRELNEEVGIAVTHASPLINIEHDYGDKQVELDVYTVTGFDGEPYGKEAQPSRWVDARHLQVADFPEANVPIIDALVAYFDQ